MKRMVISILLAATVFASISAFAESRGAHPNGLGTEVISANPAGAPSPQIRIRIGRRHRRRRFVIVRRRHYRERHYHRIYVRRGRRRY
jgi:hypothetical protein